MFRFIRIMVAVGPIVRPIAKAILRRWGLLLLFLAPLVTGCEESEAVRRDRDHVNAMQRQVTEASKEFITADAEARRDWVEAQKSFEQTRKTIVQQQADIQAGFDRLESERRDIAAERIVDLLLSDSIEAAGMVLAVLVPLFLLGWLMYRFWQTDSVPEVDAMIVEAIETAPRIVKQ
jgi:hypothetical protein